MKNSTDTENSNLKSINVLIVFMTMCGGLMFVMYTSGIAGILIGIGFFVNLALVLFYKVYKKYGRFKKIVITLRVIAITILVLMILSPITLMSFKYTKSMHPLKRFCYNYGVYGISKNNVLPSEMPKKCDDYMFITKGCVIAQDYHADAYLIFHTDKDTLKKYENHFDSLNDAERRVTHMPNPEEKQFSDEIMLKCPEELPRHVFGQLQPEHIHDFEKAIIYTVPSYYGKGCMLDYNSGLAVFWY